MNKILKMLSKKNEKVEEIINIIDPDKVQCEICKKWVDDIKLSYQGYLCKKCYSTLYDPNPDRSLLKFQELEKYYDLLKKKYRDLMMTSSIPLVDYTDKICPNKEYAKQLTSEMNFIQEQMRSLITSKYPINNLFSSLERNSHVRRTLG